MERLLVSTLTLNLITVLIIFSLKLAIARQLDISITPDRAVLGHGAVITCSLGGLSAVPLTAQLHLKKICTHAHGKQSALVAGSGDGLVAPYSDSGRYSLNITKRDDGAILRLYIAKIHVWDCGHYECSFGETSLISQRKSLNVLDHTGRGSQYCHCSDGAVSSSQPYTSISLPIITPNPAVVMDTVTLQCTVSGVQDITTPIMLLRMCNSGSGTRLDTVSADGHVMPPFSGTGRYNVSRQNNDTDPANITSTYTLTIAQLNGADCGNIFCKTYGTKAVYSPDVNLNIEGVVCPCLSSDESTGIVEVNLPSLTLFGLVNPSPVLKDTVEIRCRMRHLATSDLLVISKSCHDDGKAAVETMSVGKDLLGYYATNTRYSIIHFRRNNDVEVLLKINALRASDSGKFMCSTAGVTTLNTNFAVLLPIAVPYAMGFNILYPRCQNETAYYSTTAAPLPPPTEPEIVDCGSDLACDNLIQCYTADQLCDGKVDCDDATDEKAQRCTSSGLSKGGTAGVVVAVLLVAVILLAIFVCYFRHRAQVRKAHLLQAEATVSETQRAYRREVRRREEAEALAEENTNQISFQTFGNPPSYEDVLSSPTRFPQTMPLSNVNRQNSSLQNTGDAEGEGTSGSTAPGDVTQRSTTDDVTCIPGDVITTENNVSQPVEIADITTTTSMPLASSLNNQSSGQGSSGSGSPLHDGQGSSQVNVSGSQLEENQNDLSTTVDIVAPETIDTDSRLQNDTPVNVRVTSGLSTAPSGEERPDQTLSAPDDQSQSMHTSSLKRAGGKSRAAGKVKFADQDMETPEAAPLLGGGREAALSLPTRTSPTDTV